MKRAEQATEYIFLRVYTNSEWDYCEFSLVQISSEWCKIMEERIRAIESFKDDLSLYCHTYLEEPVGFFETPDDLDYSYAETILNKGEAWTFVSLDKDEIETFLYPESSLGACELVLLKDGSAHFSVLGKHTGEEFWTDSFDIHQILDHSKEYLRLRKEIEDVLWQQAGEYASLWINRRAVEKLIENGLIESPFDGVRKSDDIIRNVLYQLCGKEKEALNLLPYKTQYEPLTWKAREAFEKWFLSSL